LISIRRPSLICFEEDVDNSPKIQDFGLILGPIWPIERVDVRVCANFLARVEYIHGNDASAGFGAGVIALQNDTVNAAIVFKID
jgi:hypothetical protein